MEAYRDPVTRIALDLEEKSRFKLFMLKRGFIEVRDISRILYAKEFGLS